MRLEQSIDAKKEGALIEKTDTHTQAYESCEDAATNTNQCHRDKITIVKAAGRDKLTRFLAIW